MSRFANIEFDDAKRRPAKPGQAESGPRDAAHFYGKGRDAWLAGDFEGALRLFSRSLEQHPGFFEGWFGQVRMLLELGEFEEALLWSDKALELFPDHPSLLAAKAVAACRTGAMDKALAYSDNAISKRGAGSYVWLSRAEVLLARKSATAEHCLRNAANVSGNASPTVCLEAGRLLRKAGKWLSALEYLRRAAPELPKSGLLWLEMGYCRAALGMPEAATAFEQCLGLRPHWTAPKMALNRFRRRGFLKRIRHGVQRIFRRDHADQR